MDDEEAVIVHLKLSDEEFGERDERAALLDLEDRLVEAVAASQTGSDDGHETGGGFFKLYFYGPSADALLTVIRAALASETVPDESFILVRRGSDQKEQRIEL